MSAYFPSSVSSENALVEAMECVASEAPSVDTFEFFFDRGYSPRVAKTIRGLEKQSIFLAAVTTKRDSHNLAATDRQERETAIGVVERCIDAAAEYGSQGVLVNTGFAPPGPALAGAKARGALASSLESLLSYAEKRSPSGRIDLFMETGAMNRAGHELIGSTQIAVELARRLRAMYPRFFLTLDTSHLLQLGESPTAAIVSGAGVTRHVHLANWIVGQGDTHPDFGVEGSELSRQAIAGISRHLPVILPLPDLLVGVEVICREHDEKEFFRSSVRKLDWFLGDGKGNDV